MPASRIRRRPAGTLRPLRPFNCAPLSSGTTRLNLVIRVPVVVTAEHVLVLFILEGLGLAAVHVHCGDAELGGFRRSFEDPAAPVVWAVNFQIRAPAFLYACRDHAPNYDSTGSYSRTSH